MINFPRIVTNYTFEGEPCELLSVDFEKNTAWIRFKREGIDTGIVKYVVLEGIEVKIIGATL